MMTWDEKAREYAADYYAGDPSHHDAFLHGARWMRVALLTDETIERAAWGIHASHDRGDWEHEPAEVLDEYLNMARAALTAVLGGEQ